jgi:NAD(P)-dependent dehydrogenase (short-subunit alcohol dehydrogenase family)
MAGKFLAGTNGVVTGAGVRLGRALALALADAGASVCVHYAHSLDDAKQTVRMIEQRGGRAVLVQADLQQGRAACHGLVRAACEALGPIDILVNSAAIFEPASLQEVDEDHFDRHLQLNLKGPLYLSQAFAAQLSASGDGAGHIVNIADWRALKPPPGHLAYTLTKAGIVALTKMLAQELAPRVRVNAIAPGAILPPPGAGPDYEREIARRIPLGRMGGLESVTSALLFLLANDFVTGEVLCVTGGEQLM